MKTRHSFAAFATLFLCFDANAAQAVPIQVEASDNATVQPAGPRSGANGKAFFNVEGSLNGAFASYGVADFNFGALPFPVLNIISASLQLVQSNAAFSNGGGVTFSLDTRSPLSDIQPGGTSPLNFDGADPGTATDVGQGDLVLENVGVGQYVVVATGTLDNYPLTLSASAEAAIIARLNGPGTIRLTVGTLASSVAATWAGATNSSLNGPVLVLDVEYNTGVPATPETWGKIKATYH